VGTLYHAGLPRVRTAACAQTNTPCRQQPALAQQGGRGGGWGARKTCSPTAVKASCTGVWQVMAGVAREGWWRGHLVVDRFAKSEQLCLGAKKLRAGAQLDRCRGTRQWPRRVCGRMVLSGLQDYPLGPQSDDQFQIKTTLSDPSLLALLTTLSDPSLCVRSL
jgi:hypothetical protein